MENGEKNLNCDQHKYNAASGEPPIFDTGLSHCLTCVWAWANWLEEQMEASAFNLRVLDAVAFDNCDMLWWRTDGEYAPITFFVNCNDLFWWATSDAEDVTPENVHLLEESIKDVEAIDDCSSWATSLFCCRSRKMRPQGAAYPKDKRLWPLFDACGPAREVDKSGFGNPKEHP